MKSQFRTLFLRVAAAAAAAAFLAGPAAAGAYLDSAITDLKPEERVTVAAPQPVQMLFQFQTKGAINARATKFLREEVTTATQTAAVFSTVSDAPAPNGAILSITINNVPQENAAGKGFVTGLTFGLKGSTVADYYDCTFEYVPAGGGQKVTKTLRHTIYFTIGATAAPENAVKMKNINEAVITMARQAVSHGLNDLARDPGFSGAAPAATVAATAPAAEPVAAPAPVPAPAPAPAEALAAPATAAPGQ